MNIANITSSSVLAHARKSASRLHDRLGTIPFFLKKKEISFAIKEQALFKARHYTGNAHLHLTYIYICVYLHMYVCVCVCIYGLYIYIYISVPSPIYSI
jgi:hypothetical protein